MGKGTTSRSEGRKNGRKLRKNGKILKKKAELYIIR